MTLHLKPARPPAPVDAMVIARLHDTLALPLGYESILDFAKMERVPVRRKGAKVVAQSNAK